MVAAMVASLSVMGSPAWMLLSLLNLMIPQGSQQCPSARCEGGRVDYATNGRTRCVAAGFAT